MIILRTISRLMFPIMLVFGLHVAVHGHLGPGGAFPAGVIIASAFLMLDLAYPVVSEEKRETGYKDKAPKRLDMGHFVESAAVLTIAALILLTLVFLAVVPEVLTGAPGTLASAFSIFALNIFGAFAVGAGLAIIVAQFLPGEKQ